VHLYLGDQFGNHGGAGCLQRGQRARLLDENLCLAERNLSNARNRAHDELSCRLLVHAVRRPRLGAQHLCACQCA
jgi:hypothetical protein